MTKEFNIIIERDSEGYLVASVPTLRSCHSQARSLDVLMDRIREAIELRLEVQEEDIEPTLLLRIEAESFRHFL